MEWQTPKTDWKPTDYFNVEDYNRLTNNLMFLRKMAHPIVDVSFEEMELNKTYSSTNYADEFNAIERNLRELNEKTYNLDIGNIWTYDDNSYLPDYIEINRIESAMEKIHYQLEHRRDNLVTLAIEHLGRPKGFNRV